MLRICLRILAALLVIAIAAMPCALAQVSGPDPGVSAACGASGIGPSGTCLNAVGSGGASTAAGGYVGPGNILSGASAFWGLRAYSAAFAAGLNRLANICLPSDTLCADVPSDLNGNLALPASLSTCNNSTVICTVKTLYDQSGALACAGSTACDVTNATIGTRPTLVVAAAANGCPNVGKPCMAFVRASTQCLASATTLTASQPLSFVLVGIRTGSTTLQNSGIAFGAGTSVVGWNASTDTGLINFGTALTAASFTDNTWHAVQAIASNASSAFDFDGSTNAGTAGANGTSSAPVLGGRAAGCVAASLDGKMVEAGVWLGAFSAGNVTSLNTNAHAYWGF